MTEDLPQRPINPYGESKLMFEKMLRWFEQVHGLEFIAFRYFNAAGASERFGEHPGRNPPHPQPAGGGAGTKTAGGNLWRGLSHPRRHVHPAITFMWRTWPKRTFSVLPRANAASSISATATATPSGKCWQLASASPAKNSRGGKTAAARDPPKLVGRRTRRGANWVGIRSFPSWRTWWLPPGAGTNAIRRAIPIESGIWNGRIFPATPEIGGSPPPGNTPFAKRQPINQL